MPAPHHPSDAAYALIQRFEGFRARAARLPDGRFTVGYGHTASARQRSEVSEADARDLLTWDLRPVVRAVNAHTYAPLTQNQFDALTAFAFNVGVEAFRTSDVLRAVNAGRPLQAAQALEQWRQADWEGQPQVIDALVRRRAAEKALFLTPADGFIAVPAAVLPPLPDRREALREQALDLVTPLDGEVAHARDATVAPDLMAGADTSTPATTADAVADRLRALFPEELTALPPAAGRALTVDAALPTNDDEPRPRAFAAPEGDPTLSLAPPSPGADVSDPHEDEPLLLETQAIAEDPRLDLADVPEPATTSAPEPRWPSVLLFIGGAVLFAAGVNALRQIDQPAPFGWGLSLAGVAMILTAVYFLLKRREDD